MHQFYARLEPRAGSLANTGYFQPPAGLPDTAPLQDRFAGSTSWAAGRDMADLDPKHPDNPHLSPERHQGDRHPTQWLKRKWLERPQQESSSWRRHQRRRVTAALHPPILRRLD